MSDARGLLDRISAFRLRLEAAPRVAADASPVHGSAGAPPPPPPGPVSDTLRPSLRQITGAVEVVEGPLPPQLTVRAHKLLATAKELLVRQRAFATDPIIAGLGSLSEAADPLVAYHRETVAVMDSAVRLAQVFPESPSVQLKLCDGLDGVLEIVKERLTVQERALAQQRTDFGRIDRLAAVLAAMSQLRPMSLNPLATIAEEILEDARQTRPVRFLHA